MARVVINRVVYQDPEFIGIPIENGGGSKEYFYDTADADVSAADILSSKKAYGVGGAITGQMPNNGATGGEINAVAQTVTVPAGYTSGGSVGIGAAEQAKVISDNIKAGVTVLGVSGKSTVKDVGDTTATAATVMTGYEFYDAGGTKRGGSLTVPTVSYDSVTKELTIS